jgi:bifunctional DNA-binding transcriptional regulator/antitoxin component of YhaV-PrlF toxin-antitoxin module
MGQRKTLTKLVTSRSKGQITLPIEFRQRLQIEDNTILRLSLKGSKIEILPLRPVPRKEDLREYAKDDIQAFLREDRLDPETAEKVRRLFRKSA